MKDMISIFKNKAYAVIFFSNFLSQMGALIAATSLMFYMLKSFSEQPVYATVAELMIALPTLVLFIFIGTVSDRLDRQKNCFYSNLLCIILNLFLLVALKYQWLPLVFLLLFLESASQKFFYPSSQSLLKGILCKDQYALAAGLNQIVNSMFAILGTGLAVGIYLSFGIYGSLIINMLFYTISAILLSRLQLKEEIRLPNGRHALSQLPLSLVIKDFKEGFLYILKNRTLTVLVSGFIIFGLMNGVFAVLPAYTLKYKLAPDMYEQLAIMTGMIFGAGLLSGSIVASPLLKKCLQNSIRSRACCYPDFS